jgi:hypothetical protein
MKTIPQKEQELIKFARNAREKALAEAESYNLSPEDVEEIVETVDEYIASCDESKRLKVESKASTRRKGAAKTTVLKVLGRHNTTLRAKPSINDAKLVGFGLKPRDRTLSPVKAPETAPLVEISYLRLWHVVRFWEEGSTRRRRKPEGVIGAEIYVNFGGDRDDLDAYQLKQIAVRSPFIFKYEMADLGKQVHYYLVWLTRRGERSPSSRIASATVAS